MFLLPHSLLSSKKIAPTPLTLKTSAGPTEGKLTKLSKQNWLWRSDGFSSKVRCKITDCATFYTQIPQYIINDLITAQHLSLHLYTCIYLFLNQSGSNVIDLWRSLFRRRLVLKLVLLMSDNTNRIRTFYSGEKHSLRKVLSNWNR